MTQIARFADKIQIKSDYNEAIQATSSDTDSEILKDIIHSRIRRLIGYVPFTHRKQVTRGLKWDHGGSP